MVQVLLPQQSDLSKLKTTYSAHVLIFFTQFVSLTFKDSFTKEGG